MYEWKVTRVSGMKLEPALNSVEEHGWEVFAIIQAGEDPNAPSNDRYYYTVIARHRRQSPNQ
jgi:hypothetical protein